MDPGIDSFVMFRLRLLWIHVTEGKRLGLRAGQQNQGEGGGEAGGG